MKVWLPLLISVLCIMSCDKNKDSGAINSAALCMDTAFLRTSIPESLTSVSFVNEQVGFVAGRNGGIYKTIDAGKSWINETATVSLPIYGLYFLDEQTGFAVGGESSCPGTGCTPPGGFILKTTDGGATWRNVYTPTDKIEVRSVFFVNASTGFCVGNNVIFKTADGGQNWSEYRINNLHGQMMQVQFANTQEGYIACLNNDIVKTENAGLTWQVIHPNQDGDSSGFVALSVTNNAIYLAGQTTILKSTDKGNSWTAFPHSPKDIFAIHFVDDNQGFAFGRGNYSGGDFGYSFGSIYCTENGGNTWNGTADIQETGTIMAVSFPTNRVGFAVSGNRLVKLTVQ